VWVVRTSEMGEIRCARRRFFMLMIDNIALKKYNYTCLDDKLVKSREYNITLNESELVTSRTVFSTVFYRYDKYTRS